MKFKLLIFNILIFFNLPFFLLGSSLSQNASTWPKSSQIDEYTWTTLSPYLIPFNHPIKAKLDSIFLRIRATANPEAMKMAGFEALGSWKWDKVYVAKHADLKGYLIKAYLDDHFFMDDRLLVQRIVGAEALRSAINIFEYQNYFKVPKKWLYLLPEFPPTLPGLKSKYFILVVEDMDLVDYKRNKKMFRNHMTEKSLQALYHLLILLGLPDSTRITNISFSKDKKIAFVDTERNGLWPIPFSTLKPALGHKMRIYWENLTRP